MAGVCSDNRFEIIAKVKEHLIKATNIEMQPEELKQADNILFRLWQLGYFKQVEFERENAELKEENKKWKDEWQEQVQKENDESYARTLQTIQLNKAKELLREIIDTPVFIQMGGESYENEGYTELVEEAEDFLKEVE